VGTLIVVFLAQEHDEGVGQGSPTWCSRTPGRPRARSKINISINVFTLTNINTKIIGGKSSKNFKCIALIALRIDRYTRSSSHFRKGWWPPGVGEPTPRPSSRPRAAPPAFPSLL